MEVLVLLDISEENPFSNLKQLKSSTSPTKSYGSSPIGLVFMYRQTYKVHKIRIA